MSADKLLVLLVNLILNVFHYVLNWIVARIEKHRFLDDISKLGADIAFIGVTFIVASNFDVTSRFFGFLDEGDSGTMIKQSTLSVLVAFFFYILSIFFYKVYEKEKRKSKRLKETTKVWSLFVSYLLGTIVLIASINLM